MSTSQLLNHILVSIVAHTRCNFAILAISTPIPSMVLKGFLGSGIIVGESAAFCYDQSNSAERTLICCLYPPQNRALWQAFIHGFSDLNHTIDHAIADGEFVATRETLRGTNDGEFQGRPPTGNSVEFSCVALWRFVEGKLVEYRVDADLLGLYEQLGMEMQPVT